MFVFPGFTTIYEYHPVGIEPVGVAFTLTVPVHPLHELFNDVSKSSCRGIVVRFVIIFILKIKHS
jgi:hypothetical protein